MRINNLLNFDLQKQRLRSHLVWIFAFLVLNYAHTRMLALDSKKGYVAALPYRPAATVCKSVNILHLSYKINH